MKIPRGKEVLANKNNIKIVVDWDDLLRYRGGMKNRLMSEKIFGQILAGMSGLLLAAAIVIPIIQGSFNTNAYLGRMDGYGLMAWMGVGLYCYSLFLRRDKQQFTFNLEGSRYDSLTVLQKHHSADGAQDPVVVEFDDVLDVDLWEIIDTNFYKYPQGFFAHFCEDLIETETVQQIMHRLGLYKSAQQQLMATAESAPQELVAWKSVLAEASDLSVDLEFSLINCEVVFIALAEKLWKQQLMKLNVPEAELAAVKLWLRNRNRRQRYLKTWHRLSRLKPTGVVNRAYTSRYAPTLEQYGEDYTAQAAEGEFVISIAKEQPMRELLRTMHQHDATALLIGKPGVGKTHFLKYLAVRMVVEDVPASMQDYRLVNFDLAKVFTITKNFDDFKLVLQNLFVEVSAAGNVILILDNLDQALNVRKDLQAEMATLINNGLSKYEIRAIATASVDGFNRYLKPQAGLMSNVQQIQIPQPAPEQALQILIDAARGLEQENAIGFQLPALRQIVKLAPKFDSDRVLPDKGIALMEETQFAAKQQNLNIVSVAVVDKLVSEKVGVSVGNLSVTEAEKLVNIEDKLHERVVGQHQAIKAIANALRRARAGLKNDTKPVASFLFFGPTGVGKTEVAKTLAATYYGAEKMMTRIDMSEYQEQQNLTRLIGQEQDGEFSGGQLTEAVRRKPFSLVLLDEIEKANPKVLDLLLQILDEGFVTDGMGRKVDFSNTIIILTSNAASRQIAELVHAGQSYQQVLQQVTPKLRKIFRVEFLNRFDQIIMFKPLSPIEIEQIADKMLAKLQDTLLEQGYHFHYTEQVVKDLVDIGYNPIYGARQMQRAIQDHVEDKIATAIVSGELNGGGEFILDGIKLE